MISQVQTGEDGSPAREAGAAGDCGASDLQAWRGLEITVISIQLMRGTSILLGVESIVFLYFILWVGTARFFLLLGVLWRPEIHQCMDMYIYITLRKDLGRPCLCNTPWIEELLRGSAIRRNTEMHFAFVHPCIPEI